MLLCFHEEFLEESCGENGRVFRGINTSEEPQCAKGLGKQKNVLWETEGSRVDLLVHPPSIGFINRVWWGAYVQGHNDMGGPHSDMSSNQE